jgi:RHS repeat-associated protein
MTAATYDGNGLRASATTGAGTENFTWNFLSAPPNLIMDSNNAYIYTSGPAPTEQVSLSAGTVTYLNTDSLGSVRGTVNSSGTLTGTTSYDAWGNPETAGGLTATTPFGYAGGYTDPTGLIYLLARYYEPGTGQFISVDPDLAQTLAPYAYTNGNPVTGTDPTGLENTLGGHDTCVRLSFGQRKAKICAEVNVSTSIVCGFVFSCKTEAQTVAKITSGGGEIAEVGVRKMGLEVCGNHHNHPRNCTPDNEVQGKMTAQCTGSNASSGSTGTECYVNGSWYTDSHVNWEDAWVRGAWMEYKDGTRSRTVNIHEHPLCRNGNKGVEPNCKPGSNYN